MGQSLGVVALNKWICEDSVLLEKDLEYSLLTSTDDVALLKISAKDMRNHLPRESLQSIKEDFTHRVEWIKARSKEILDSEFKNEQDRKLKQQMYKHTKASYPVAGRQI